MNLSQKIINRKSFGKRLFEGFRRTFAGRILKRLFEDKMTFDKALDIFGINEVPSAEELKSLHKKLALKNHPDRGGSVEKMAEINAAYDILSKNTEKRSFYTRPSQEQREENKKVYKQKQRIQLSTLKEVAEEQNSKIEEFLSSITDYFSELSGNKQVFYSEYTSNKSKIDKLDIDDDFDIRDLGSTYNPSSRFDIQIFNKERDIVFNIKMETEVEFPDSRKLSSPDLNMRVDCSGIFDGRKNKIFNKSWNNIKNATDVFNDPREIFSNGKLTKILQGKARSSKKSKFMKRDAEAYLINTLQSRTIRYTDGSFGFFIPIELYNTPWTGGKYSPIKENGIYLYMDRRVLSRVPFWSISEIVEINSEKYHDNGMKKRLKGITQFIPEKLENLEKIREIVDKYKDNLNIDSMVAELKDDDNFIHDED